MYRTRIYYKDTDAGGVVYYANYLRFFEAARTEFLLDLGLNLNTWMDQGILFVVTHAEVDYLSPARYGDLLLVETACISLSGARFDLGYRVSREEDHQAIAAGATSMACIGKTGKPVRIPKEILTALKDSKKEKR
ncbi:MAG: acyl-CoA thioesterase [Nitrospirae bacterium CG_4_9_14_3_um_filter_53_35]|nr:MAG: hypothetical protein AUK29_09180 [Nitrospirae bacterium CG2_30_53_67]PIS37999.1 MAG: acyl-CoA thioesterase [Nitrospirae bacterium CG08_land_8_20_14_0_20_52_24]PIV82881.1 MAG: acyl-CoA thioesterase [Nitrospirae bacterium CG17_big_fil_post_rev_8_21_14_2_50_50_9]PIW85685.1 MAG: acyl-CoA thioesterase [Nitrospirae bacterium CG_4_8_14_3_um_filter_50_41]PIX85040.1 MAG: acyl-CoA thioesterase [Nitrospirae bacterium CG_4_10_14_3_um_filter_53_41]PJA76984.1 MAG: acyl-CoA thioesterase [Nitrospirae 